MSQGRCAAPGCGRFVGPKSVWCPRHRLPGFEDVEMPEAIEESAEAAEFRKRLLAGDYRHLFGEALNEVIQQAAMEPGLADEIGILRVVLARLLIEERDPARLAASVSRVVGVAIQAARAQRAVTDSHVERFVASVTEALTQISAGIVTEVSE